MSWPARAYVQPAVADYGKALGQLWASLLLAVAMLGGSIWGGPYRGIVDGLIAIPAIWALGPAGWPWLRMRLRQHRHTFGLPVVDMPRDDWRLPAVLLGGYTLVLAGTAAWFRALGEGVAPWWPVTAAALAVSMVLLGWEAWIFYVLDQERRAGVTSGPTPGILTHRRSLRLLYLLEGRMPVAQIPPVPAEWAGEAVRWWRP